MNNMFYNTPNLKNITFGNNWNTSNVKDMRKMFQSVGVEKLDFSK